MTASVPVFLHLFGRYPEEMTYENWLNCREFADGWEKAQREGG